MIAQKSNLQQNWFPIQTWHVMFSFAVRFGFPSFIDCCSLQHKSNTFTVQHWRGKKRHSTQSESKSKTVYFSCCFFFHCLFTRRYMLLIHAVIELIVMQFYACETIELAISWRNMIGDHLAGEHQHTPNKCKLIKFVRKCGLFSVFRGNERKKNQIFFFCPLDIN